ncbi:MULTISPECIES: accessory Sec system translocase SecA2 [Thermobifida]|jgi:preprotein translocase subunit SecA|uniref:Protein translocase subunit SecA 2 n=1 Tax=Thermobifida fusca (strain YX) TaxID=269800 RepID=SECA2_THEFY|nr:MULTISPECIES: accessory Sec system translocase SecA2 [Thermobifida]Q47RW8.2 RecName: Full=Protein translocase subunit SecA 2 [Thermobifida fusca YX]MBO2529345.1 accessory Sec system translocase SecA2 [Thermobifida sp.]PPS96594.1 preprotein translocase subunit SecA [Thermobifida fusca]PZN66046.1 MAG: accessory Sec system translocase SecA2 [Thermobifida fusca]QOS60311.1 accessory Sec system translocase SecA2 [Thermobifida fusca]
MAEGVRRLLGKPGSVSLQPYIKLLKTIEEREEALRKLSDAELTEVATELGNAELPYDRDDLAELCALGREAARRTLGERPFDTQLIGMMALLDGHVAEMATGEGKTLTGALAAVGFALRGQRVHVLSVNDYLARRDAEWMRPLYTLLGVEVGWISQESTTEERRAAYAADITYASVSELGFDVLRDRLATDVSELVVPEPNVAIIDEADSVLVDEARVPLVLAGAAEPAESDAAMAELVRRLRPGIDYKVDDDGRNVHLTDTGINVVEKALGGVDLFSAEDTTLLSRVNLALHAHALLHRDVHYVVRDGKVRLINESRGRIALLQRWPDGLQAAVEAKEHLTPSETGEVLDSITVQSLVLRYPIRCGMTGTAMAVAEQLREFYELEVAVIAPNKPNIRIDEEDRLYATAEEKEEAVVEKVKEVHATGRPILIGTQDVAESERLAKRLRRAGLECVVLNAKNDAEEAAVIAEAGTYGRITVSTQMAGRGTDIRLGGSDMRDRDRVVKTGGLYVIGYGRYPSSRLDDQLRGRAGRQGDPGGSVFYVSVEDDLITTNLPEAKGYRVSSADGEITDPAWKEMVNHAQRIAEGQLLELHRNTWRYNQIIDVQRSVVLEQRRAVLHEDLGSRQLAVDCPETYQRLVEEVGEEEVARAARLVTLYHLDRGWADHNAFLADLREGIHLRFLGRRDPLDEFNRDAVPAFKGFLDEARARAAEMFEKLEVVDGRLDVAAAGVKRPSTTWTYMVQDQPFSTDLENIVGRVKNLMGRD